MNNLLNTLKLMIVTAVCFSCTASAVDTPPAKASLTARRTASDGPGWKDWTTAYKEYAASKRPLIIDVYTNWCYWCKVMDKETYSKKSVQQKIAAGFVPFKFNPEAPGTYDYQGKSYSGKQLEQILSQGQLQGYPTTLFLSPAGKAYVYSGYYKENDFLAVLDEVQALIKKEQ